MVVLKVEQSFQQFFAFCRVNEYIELYALRHTLNFDAYSLNFLR
jgi:hypothetical protein